MSDDRTLFQVTSESLKNAGVAVSIAATLFGVISFATHKINDYDSYGPRIAKLEARDQTITALSDADKTRGFSLETQKSDLGGLQRRVDQLSDDVIKLRLDAERLRTIVESRK